VSDTGTEAVAGDNRPRRVAGGGEPTETLFSLMGRRFGRRPGALRQNANRLARGTLTEIPAHSAPGTSLGVSSSVIVRRRASAGFQLAQLERVPKFRGVRVPEP
jgi:hypothetical protein